MSTVLPRARYLRAALRLNAKLTAGLTTLGGVSLLGLGALAQLPNPGHAEPVLAVATPLEPESPTPLATIESQDLIADCAAVLADAERVLAKIASIEATFEKRERLKGRLQPSERIEIKVRHEPMSVYMRWAKPDDGQEVLWQENARGGLIYVHPGGFRGRLMSLVKVSPDSAQVKEGSRRPIGEVGLWALNERLIELVQDFANSPVAVQAKLDDTAEIGGRPCTAYRFVRPEGATGASPARLRIFIDREHKLAVAAETHVLPAGASDALLDEYYAYYDLRLDAKLGDRDFTPDNKSYNFGQ